MNYLTEKVKIYPLVTIRFLFGLMMVIGGIRFIINDWVDKLYVQPNFFFKFYGFHWVEYIGDDYIYPVFYLMIASAIGIALGLFYRLSAITFFLTFTYIELLDATNYLNHYYLVCILALFFCIVPAHRAFSIDQHLFKLSPNEYIPRWCVDIFKLQLIIVYTCAGLAKLSPDWLFDAMPLRVWLPEKTATPLIGWLFQYAWVPYVFSWAGALYDITIGYLLLSRKWRPYAYVIVCVFHGFTHLLFNIGLFPFIMTLMTLVFFSGDFHKRFYRFFGFRRMQNKTLHYTNVFVPILILHFVIQILMPFRHHLYASQINWKEEGYRFAWRVMLVEKSGQAIFQVTDKATGRTTEVENRNHLTAFQEKQMAIQPDFIIQYAHYLADYYRQNHNFTDPKVTVTSNVTLNGRPSREFVKSNLDLTQINITFAPTKWVND